MMKRLNTFGLILILAMAFCQSHAQELSREVISVSGGMFADTDYTLEWTLGELAIQTGTAHTTIFTEGFHQSELEITPVTKPDWITPEELTPYTILVFPNPVSASFTVRMDGAGDNAFDVLLYSIHGSLLKKTVMHREVHLDISQLPPGMYILRILEKGTMQEFTYRISKI